MSKLELNPHKSADNPDLARRNTWQRVKERVQGKLSVHALIWAASTFSLLIVSSFFDQRPPADSLVLTNMMVLTTRSVLTNPVIVTNFELRVSSPVSTNPLVILGDSRRKVEFAREEAIKFAFDQVTKIIGYLFAAAVAALGLMVKLLVDPIVDSDKKRALSPKTIVFFWNASIGCCASITCGIWAYSQFPKMATNEAFSLYDGEVGLPVFLQEFTFVVAFIFAMLGVLELLLATNKPCPDVEI